MASSSAATCRAPEVPVGMAHGTHVKQLQAWRSAWGLHTNPHAHTSMPCKGRRTTPHDGRHAPSSGPPHMCHAGCHAHPCMHACMCASRTRSRCLSRRWPLPTCLGTAWSPRCSTASPRCPPGPQGSSSSSRSLADRTRPPRSTPEVRRQACGGGCAGVGACMSDRAEGTKLHGVRALKWCMG